MVRKKQDLLHSPSPQRDKHGTRNLEFNQEEEEEEDSPRVFLDDLCRICAKKETDMVPIFSPSGATLRLQHKINTCLPIQVDRKDNLPLSVCRSCTSKVDTSYQLNNMCQEADATLRKIIGHQEAQEPPSVEFIKCEYEEVKMEIVEHPIRVETPEPVKTIPVTKLPITGQKLMTLQSSNTGPRIAPKPIGMLIGPINVHFDPNSSVVELPKVPLFEHVPIAPPPEVKQDADGGKNFKMKLRNSLKQLIVSKNPENRKKLLKNLVLDDKEVVKRCEECDDKFSTMNMYYVHMLQMHKTYLCEVHPEFKTNNYNEYKKHRSLCREHLCPTCGKTFVKKSKFKEHLQTHGEKCVECPQCDKLFISNKLLKKHSLVHVTKLNFVCNICEKRFKTEKYLQNHTAAVHNPSWNFCCNMCESTATTRAKILKHCETTHSDSEKCKVGVLNMFVRTSPFQCSQCHKYYASKPILTRHVNQHHKFPEEARVDYTKKKLYSCDNCDRTFRIKNLLKCHMASHLGVKEFECHLCDKSFHAYCFLRDHLAYHKDTSVFTCPTCDRPFSSKTGLNLHIKAVHLNLRPYKCQHCGKGFKAVNALKCHLRVHSSERFKCDFCDKSYKQLFDKKKHEKKRHPMFFEDSTEFIYSIEIL